MPAPRPSLMWAWTAYFRWEWRVANQRAARYRRRPGMY